MDAADAPRPPSRLRTAAFAPIGDEARADYVVSRIVLAISNGAFIEGERLPSETELSNLLGVAVVTVRDALGMLRDRGLIETRRGRAGGSFVSTSRGAVYEINARALVDIPRVALADLGVIYETVCGACARYATRRASPAELDLVSRMLDEVRGLDGHLWRRRITEVQLELAGLSQSIRLTRAHVKVQTEFTPLLSLQDLDDEARIATHDALAAQVAATRSGDEAAALAAIGDSVRDSVKWLVAFRTELGESGEPDGIAAALAARGMSGVSEQSRGAA